jgi:hypothetical protein
VTEVPNPQTSGQIAPWHVYALFLGVAALWAATPVIMVLTIDGMEERGQAGDLFGTINALFSGLAFAGVIVAILLQREELALQRLELKFTRDELKRSATAQEKSEAALNKTIHAQTFKVALDIIESENVINSRRRVYVNLRERRNIPQSWSEDNYRDAEVVSRSFESVGTMIRRGILPAEYIIHSWSIPIARAWAILEKYIYFRRELLKDPFVGVDFEMLAGQAKEFLNEQGVPLPD